MLISSFKMPNYVQKRPHRPGKIAFQPIEFSKSLPFVLNPHSDSSGSSSTLHYHNAVEVSLCTRGRGIFFIEENVFPYHEGTLVQVAPNVLHIAHSEGRQDPQWLTIYIDLQYLGAKMSAEALPLNPALGSQVLDIADRQSIKTNLKGLSREYFRQDPFSRMGMLGHLQVLLVELYRSLSSGRQGISNRNSGFEKIAPALNHIAANLDQPITVQLLAGNCGMSESNFRRTFNAVMGESPHQYILTTRIQFAKSLLHDKSIRVVEVAGRCGFDTLSTFNRSFLKRTGMSPRQWRNEQVNRA